MSKPSGPEREPIRDTRPYYVHRALERHGGAIRCLWQLTPWELPRDLVPMAMELWQDSHGGLHLFQFLLDPEGRKARDWWAHIRHVTRFEAGELVADPRGSLEGR